MSSKEASSKEALNLLCLNTVDVINKEDLLSRLEESSKTKNPLRIKAGFDPSAPDIHLGHTVLLRKLRQFQDLGHKVILLIGDFTAMIGDPTGKTQTRPALSKAEVEENAKTYQAQAFKILDKDPKKIEIVHNNDSLGKMLVGDFTGRVASQVTVARTLERDDFEKRMADNQPLSVREFLYPLYQGDDSVAIQADVELGGTDQKFNLLMGRQLQKSFGQKPQIVMTLPLLIGLDGAQKMSKSLGNYVAVTDTAKDMFGKIMSIPDSLMADYFNLLTNMPCISMVSLQEEMHPKAAKIKLAKLIVSTYFGEKTAEQEADAFDRVFSKREMPTDLDEVKVGDHNWIIDILKKTGVSSSSEARRLIEQGAISLIGDPNAEKGYEIKDPNAKIVLLKNEAVIKQHDFVSKIYFPDGVILKIGKKKFVKLI